VQPLPIIPLLFIYQPKTIDNAIALPGDVFPLIDVSNALPDLAAIASVASAAVVAFVAVAALPVQLPDEPDTLPVTLPVKAPLNDVEVVTPVTTAPRENPAEPVSSLFTMSSTCNFDMSLLF
tara:strand:- start:211 stop:576 length:366 start_codon:yes stop_codon:yes gene_type:complete